jgi:hypothetical protein
MKKQRVGNESLGRARRTSSLAAAGALTLLAAQAAAPALAGTTEQAERIYERLAGVKPSQQVLDQMVTALGGPSAPSASPDSAALVAAAAIATDPITAPTFYNVTLKNWAMPWTNRNQSVFMPLNDYVATVIGMVRDNVPFDQVLYGDILYTVQASGLPAPSPANNNHYAQAEANGVDLSSTSTGLKQATQSGVYGTPTAATAGVMTTAAGAGAYFINGTNRAMFRFTMINYMCNDMQTLMDTSQPTDRIRQDVSRSPGGDSRIFLNNCVACHSGMDPMAQAFAYYNFDTSQNQLVYTPGQTQAKYHINTLNFPQGFVTPDDSWSNRWRSGPNSVFGWSPSLPGSGNGAKSWGQEIAGSRQFAACKVQQVYQAVCFRSPNSSDTNTFNAITSSFQSGYNLKSVFQKVAATCAGN